MLVSILGSTCQWCQIPALRAGFEALGHTHTDDWQHPDVSFVFVGNPPYSADILSAARANVKKVILNVLDLPVQNPDGMRWINEWRAQLPDAQRVTSISAYTQSQLIDICGIQSDVIYYPMKPVSRMTGARYSQYKALLCGRVGDRNKRYHVALAALFYAGFNRDQIAVVGPEDPRTWETYMGVVNDKDLNIIYNSVDYVFMTSHIEGLGLPGLEGACAGAIPIVLPDLSTYDELWAGSPMGLWYQTFTSPGKIAEFIVYMEANPAEKQIMKDAMYAYAQSHFAPKFSAVEVAKRIIGVYHSIAE